MPAKAGVAARRKRRTPAFRRPPPEAVRTAALDVLRRRRGSAPSQAELARIVRPMVRAEVPLAALGGRRLRRLLLTTPGVRVEVDYAEREVGSPPKSCPVCGGALVPIPNRTLDGDRVVLGARCPTCGYWTHRRRRVPVRYSFRVGSGAAGEAPPPSPSATARRSG
jgi:hypothetical protein